MTPQLRLHTSLSWIARGLAAAVLAASMQVGYAQDEQARTWSDASGKFKVSAKLIGQEGGAVRLEKPDGGVITVGIAKLSKADQDYLARRVKRVSYKEIQLGEPQLITSLTEESQRLPLEAQPVVNLLSDTVGPLDPDPAPAVMPYSPLAVPMRENDAYVSWGKPVAIAPESGVIAIAANDSNAGAQPGVKQGSLLRCAYGRRLPDLILQIDKEFHLVGHHAASGRTLARIGGADYNAQGDLVLLEGVLDGSVRAVCRRSPPLASKSTLPVTYERMWLIDGSRVAVATFDTVYVYDLVENKAIYKRPARFAVMSPGGKYLASCEDGFVRIIETSSGDSLGTIPAKADSNTKLSFDPSGSKLAVVALQQLSVWDLTTASMQVETISPDYFGAPIGWVGDNLIYTDTGNLVDTKAGMTIWKYYIPLKEAEVTIGGGLLCVTDENSIDVLRSLPIPHPAAAKLSEKLSRGAPKDFIIQPGDAVRVSVESDQPVDKDAIREALEESVAKAGWVPSEKAAIEVAAVIGRGKQENLSFQFGYGSDRRSQSATITPFTAQLQIRKAGQVVWSSYRSKNVPTVILVTGEKTLQEAVSEFEKPDEDFFRRIQVPPAIPGPSLMKLVGRSDLKAGAWVDK